MNENENLVLEGTENVETVATEQSTGEQVEQVRTYTEVRRSRECIESRNRQR